MMTTIILFFFSILLASTSSLFTISNNQFMINNKPIRILSGNMHYFRTPPEYWEENLDRLLSLGFNAVEFYIPWNYHETEYNVYDFTTKGKNVTYFLEIIKDRKMYALIRVSTFYSPKPKKKIDILSNTLFLIYSVRSTARAVRLRRVGIWWFSCMVVI